MKKKKADKKRSKKQETTQEKEPIQIAEEQSLEEKLQEEKDRYLRLYAEFENFRKRTAKDRLELFETAGESIIKNLLPVLDDFERAIAEINKSKDDEALKGVQLIFDKFKNILLKEGLSDIEIKKGDAFDAEIHEAIAQVPVDDKKMSGKIFDVVEKGYKLGNKVIRFPKVVTGQ